MTDILLPLGVFLAAYLVGAIPFGYLIARSRGVDLFKHGSGNIGATNVGRLLGRKLGVLVFLLDFAKGALPTLAGLGLGALTQPRSPGPETLGVVAGLAALLGHLFPIYLGFRGGKGVATGAGVVAVLLPVPTLFALLAWATVLSCTRFMSLASLTAAVVLCLARLTSVPNPLGETERILTGFSLVTAALVVFRHRGNVRRLLGGNENRLEDSVTMTTFSKVLHVLAVGLWFGGAVFFSFVVAPTLFSRFESLTEQPPEIRKWWFPPAGEFDREDYRHEQGTRAAGYAISPMFDWYFLMQGVCGVVAMATALRWSMADPASKVHRWRSVVLIAAVATVVLGWPLERYVHALRFERNEKVDIYLRTAADEQVAPEAVANAEREARAARGLFGMMHGISLLLNFGTLGLVTAAMALAAMLPATQPKPAALTPAAPVAAAPS
jgi:acyl-phosphate glycerol 3-phosphate acyltransferase